MGAARRTRSASPAGGLGSGGEEPVWTAERIRALGASTDLATAAAILGISTSAAYKLARRNAFPVPLFRAGAYYRVPTAPILRALHLEPKAGSQSSASNAATDDGAGYGDGG